jgi:dephospho-CoA kinase
MILGVTGTNGAGKGVVVDYLKTKGFVHFSVRDALTALLTAEGKSVDRSALRERANALRAEHGAGCFVERFLEEIQRSGIENAVIESVRTTGEATSLKKQGVKLIAVDADRRIRYERIIGRGSATDKVDFDAFVQEEEREWHGALGAHDMNLLEVLKMADYTIKNEGTLEELHSAVDNILKNLK